MTDDRPFVTIELKILKECETGELVRGDFRAPDNIDWGIVAQDRCVVVVSGADAPRRLDYTANDRLFGLRCLSYGKQFKVLPDYTAPFTIADNFPDGTLICARALQGDIQSVWYLSGTRDTPSHYWYFNLDDFGAMRAAESVRAGFADWAIWAWLPSDPYHLTKLYAHPPKPAP